MNTAVTRRAGHVLPEITSHSNRRRRSPHYRLKKEPLQPGLTCQKSAQIPSKQEVAQFRNSLKQSICVEMLREGYHRSFSELFSLLRSDRDRRAAAEPGSPPRLQAPLEEQQDKLETIRLHLCQAEQAEWTGSWSLACDRRLLLGLHFSAPEDLLLSLHFFHSCADRERGGCSRPATEARACMTELYLQQGHLEQARDQAQKCLQQAEDGGWLDSGGRPLRLRARQALWRVYSRLADGPLAAGRHKRALALLHKGYSSAAESEDKQMEEEAARRLGLAYQSAGDHDAAKKFLSVSMQICGTLQDADGLGKAYKAMAKSLESEGNLDGAVHCLEELADISCSNGLQNNWLDACLCLGNIYCTMCHYTRACQSFLQGYEVACNIGDEALLQKAQVLLASARAHAMIRKFIADVEAATPDALRRLMAWKETRGEPHENLRTNPADHPDAAWF